MDPLTHTLVGANLGSTRFASKTALAGAACVIGANLPDVDAVTYFMASDLSIGFRRGWTHGVLALVVLPVVLWALLLAWDRIRGSRGESRVERGRLLALCYLAVLTHPFLDWLNSYGMRWLMPFDGTWTYGDSVFIVDPWLWLILAVGWLLGRRPGLVSVMVWALFTGLVVWAIGVRAPSYLPIVGGVALVTLISLIWRVRLERSTLAAVSLLAAAAWISGLLILHEMTLDRVEPALEERGFDIEGELFTGPLPLDPLEWDVLFEEGETYRFGTWSWRSGTVRVSDVALPMAPPEILEEAASNPATDGFVTWARYPWFIASEEEGGTRIDILDARYSRRAGEGFAGATLVMETRSDGDPVVADRNEP